jgi:DivIVA domain-containing protein
MSLSNSHSTPGERFTRSRLRPGYRVEDVDDFLTRAEAGLVSADDVERVQFTSTRLFSEGYDEEKVDAALDVLAKCLRETPGAAAAPATQRASDSSLWNWLFRRRSD